MSSKERLAAVVVGIALAVSVAANAVMARRIWCAEGSPDGSVRVARGDEAGEGMAWSGGGVTKVAPAELGH